MVKLSFYCLRLYALRKGISCAWRRPASTSWKSRSVFGQGELSRSKSWCLSNRKCFGAHQLGHCQQFPSLRLKVAQAQYHQPLSCYVGSRGKGNQSTSSITSSWQITFANIWRQVPHLHWRRQHGLLPQEVRESLGGDRQVRAWEHATVHTHMEAVRNAFSVALSLCWGDKQHIFCKETYHDSWKTFEAGNGGLYLTGPWWKKPKWSSTFRCPNHSINASAWWAYRTRCLKSKKETTAAFSLEGNEDVHFKQDSTAVAASLARLMLWLFWVHCNHRHPPNQTSHHLPTILTSGPCLPTQQASNSLPLGWGDSTCHVSFWHSSF